MSWLKNVLGLQPKNYGQWYVYGLLDPRFQDADGRSKIFYIGKGSHDRMYAHEKEMQRLMKRGTPGAKMALSCKHKRIIEIRDAGMEVGYDVLYRTDEEGDSYRAERHYIEDIGLENLTNETFGLSDKAIDRLIRRRLAS